MPLTSESLKPLEGGASLWSPAGTHGELKLQQEAPESALGGTARGSGGGAGPGGAPAPSAHVLVLAVGSAGLWHMFSP